MAPLQIPPDTTIVVPGSKSHTNRALICAALAPGTSGLEGALFADDTIAMVGALLSLGISIWADPEGRTITVMNPTGEIPSGPADLDVRMSGTTSRFLLPLLCLGEGEYRMDGSSQLRSRPIKELVTKLRQLGAEIDGDALPLTVHGGSMRGGSVVVQGSVSSQYLSGLLMAAPRTPEGLYVRVGGELVSKPYVDLTIKTMHDFGVEVEAHPEYREFSVAPAAYKPSTVSIEPDASAASYFFAAAAITGGRVRIDGLGHSTTQGDLRFVEILQRMGAEVKMTATSTEVRGTGTLTGLNVDMRNISDTAQTLAVVATFANSPTEITGIGFIRKKETDRIAAVVTELTRRGIRAAETADGMIIYPGPAQPGTVTTYEDHRMAMSFALLGLVHPGIAVSDPACVGKTFPEFFEVLDTLRPEPMGK
ncbi:MAG: 3-phosphoshikimate 1-carboxyvinyltransferase [Acidimicrobiales bacterium]|nr:3-phosphoshikimate 1-carboxyvinyltransferase [Acidimicrobiales bacterium]